MPAMTKEMVECRTGARCRTDAGENEDTGADDRTDTHRGERPRPERAFEAALFVASFGQDARKRLNSLHRTSFSLPVAAERLNLPPARARRCSYDGRRRSRRSSPPTNQIKNHSQTSREKAPHERIADLEVSRSTPAP